MRPFNRSLLITAAVIGGALAGCGSDGHSGGGSSGGHGGDAGRAGMAGAGAGGNGTGGGAAGRGGAGGSAGAAGGANGGAAGSGIPGVIVVTTPSGYTATEAEDGYCDILEAVAAATSGRSVRECANESGATRIILTAGKTYPTTKTLRVGGGAALGLADGATGSATITAAVGWVTDPADPATRCLVSAAADTLNTALVGLTDVTLSQDPSLSLSGVCVAHGFLDLRRDHVTGFRRSGIVATCLPASGCDHANNPDDATSLRVMSTLVDDNASPDNGGGISSEGEGAVVTVYHSAIMNNTSDGGGGGLYFGGGFSTDIIQASTVSGNHASVGGGILVRFTCTNTYLNVFHSTIANNTADQTGGGIEFEPADLRCATQDVSLYSTIVAGNHSVSTSENNINAGWDGSGNFDCSASSFVSIAPGLPRPSDITSSCVFDLRDARLGAAVPMGGVGDLPAHPLLAGSPAIDAAADDQSTDEQRDAWIPLVDPGMPEAWTLFDRVVDGDGDGTAVRDVGAIEMNSRWQTELLAVAASGASPHTVVTTPDGFDRGAGTRYGATSATNEFVTYRLPIAEAGDYDFTVGVLEAADGGQFQLSLADAPTGPWTPIGSMQDGYAPAMAFAALGPFAGPKLPTPGERFVRLAVTGKNPASAGFTLSLDYIDAKKSALPCPISQVAAGASHTCALLATGGVRCWGHDDNGQLGDGKTIDRPTPPAIDILTGVKAIAAGAAHTCALLATGGVRCWGLNANGQLGDGTVTGRATPGTTDVLTGATAISAGDAHTCALMMGGGVRCWGLNDHGQLGDGTTSDRAAPPASDVLGGVTAIAAGGAHTCALMAGGGVRCWGLDSFGQLGDGTTDDRTSPPSVDAIGDVATIATGSRHTCAVTTAGGLRCWGRNEDGELGLGTYVDQSAPGATDVLGGVQSVAAGLNFTCALTVAGGVRCWGYNSDGQIGDDTALAVDRTAPATTDVLGQVHGIGVGFAHTCALMTSGGLRCWGADAAGQLGDGLAPDQATTPPATDVAGFAGTCR